MSFTPFHFNVTGKPVTKGSLKNVARRGQRPRLVEANKGADEWRQKIGWVARKFAAEIPQYAPVLAELKVMVPRPRHHYRDDGAIKPQYREHLPSKRSGGDLDKHCRMLLDALQDVGVIGDDAQVTDLVARKRFADGTPGIYVAVAPAD